MNKPFKSAFLALSLLLPGGAVWVCDARAASTEAARAAQPLQSVRYAVLTKSVGASYVDLGIAQGIYAKHGVAVDFKVFANGGPEVMAAVAGGGVDAGTCGTPILTGVARGVPIRIVAGSPLVKGGTLLAAKPAIKRVEDLRGKVVSSAGAGSGPYQSLVKILEAHGLSLQDVKFQVSHGGNALQLFQSGQVDAVVLGDLDVVVAEKLGLGHELADSSDYLGDVQTSFIFAGNDFISARPEALRGLLAAEFESRAYARDHLDDWVAFAHKSYPSYDEDVIRRYLKGLVKRWDYAGTVRKAATRRYLKVLLDLGDLKGVDVGALKDSDLFDLRFLPAKVKP